MLLPTLRRSLLTTRVHARAPLAATARPFSQSPIQLARKDTQDKDSLKPEPNEYSKSGSDDAAAAVEQAAFDPNQTRPEQEQATADKESGGEVSSIHLYHMVVCEKQRLRNLAGEMMLLSVRDSKLTNS